MFKQKPKYEQPTAEARWCKLDKVITASPVSFGDTGNVSTEDFEQDGVIDF